MFTGVKVSFSQLPIVPFETATAGPICLVTKSFSLCSSLSLILAIYSFMTLTGHRHSSSAHCRAIVGACGWFGLAFLAPNTGRKVNKSSVICIAFGVILNKFRSDHLLTVANAKIMTIFRIRQDSLRLRAFPIHATGLRPSSHPWYQPRVWLVGSF